MMIWKYSLSKIINFNLSNHYTIFHQSILLHSQLQDEWRNYILLNPNSYLHQKCDIMHEINFPNPYSYEILYYYLNGITIPQKPFLARTEFAHNMTANFLPELLVLLEIYFQSGKLSSSLQIIFYNFILTYKIVGKNINPKPIFVLDMYVALL